jgi:tetratricopeptide (TPR) repeat protein
VDALVDAGSFDEAMAVAEDSMPRMEETADAFDLVLARSAKVRVLTRRGQLAEATPLADWAVQGARKMSDPQSLAQALPSAAALRLALGDAAAAVALLTELERIPHVRHASHYAPDLPDAVRTALAAKDADLAARLTEGLEPIYPLHEHALASARALLAEHRGEHAEAAEHFASAADRWDEFGVPWEAAQALLGQGRCLLALGVGSEAAAGPLRQARAIFASLDARPALAETDALLEQATALTS